jgi:hypothetical protein
MLESGRQTGEGPCVWLRSPQGWPLPSRQKRGHSPAATGGCSPPLGVLAGDQFRACGGPGLGLQRTFELRARRVWPPTSQRERQPGGGGRGRGTARYPRQPPSPHSRPRPPPDTVNGQRSMVNGQRSTVNGIWSTVQASLSAGGGARAPPSHAASSSFFRCAWALRRVSRPASPRASSRSAPSAACRARSSLGCSILGTVCSILGVQGGGGLGRAWQGALRGR